MRGEGSKKAKVTPLVKTGSWGRTQAFRCLLHDACHGVPRAAPSIRVQSGCVGSAESTTRDSSIRVCLPQQGGNCFEHLCGSATSVGWSVTRALPWDSGSSVINWK